MSGDDADYAAGMEAGIHKGFGKGIKNIEQQTLFKGWSKGVSESLGWSRPVTQQMLATREYKQAKEDAEAYRISLAALEAEEAAAASASASSSSVPGGISQVQDTPDYGL